MSESAYSDLKPAYHLDKIADLRAGRLIVPAQVQLILSDLCNQDCHFCSYRMSGGFSSENFADSSGNRNPKRMISYEKALEVLQDCKLAGVQGIQFTGGGEPTVHPQHLELFEACLGHGMQAALVSNGVVFRKGWEGVLPRFSWVRISIDAGGPLEYARVRRVPGDLYAKAVGNVSALAAEIVSQRTDCLLGVGYVITLENYSNLVEGVKRLADTGAAYVRLSAMFSTQFEDYYHGHDSEIRKNIDALKKLESADFRIVDLYGARIRDLQQHRPDYTLCGYQQFNVYIGGDLKVYRCCTTAYTTHGEVGDLTKTRFIDWLYSEERKEKVKSFDAHSCNVCQFNGKNRVIDYLVTGKPTHVEFV